jgi:hypothetical protein
MNTTSVLTTTSKKPSNACKTKLKDFSKKNLLLKSTNLNKSGLILLAKVKHNIEQMLHRLQSLPTLRCGGGDTYCPQITSWSLRCVNVLRAVQGSTKHAGGRKTSCWSARKDVVIHSLTANIEQSGSIVTALFITFFEGRMFSRSQIRPTFQRYVLLPSSSGWSLSPWTTEAVRTSETSVCSKETTRRYIPKDSHLQHVGLLVGPHSLFLLGYVRK